MKIDQLNTINTRVNGSCRQIRSTYKDFFEYKNEIRFNNNKGSQKEEIVIHLPKFFKTLNQEIRDNYLTETTGNFNKYTAFISEYLKESLSLVADKCQELVSSGKDEYEFNRIKNSGVEDITEQDLYFLIYYELNKFWAEFNKNYLIAGESSKPGTLTSEQKKLASGLDDKDYQIIAFKCKDCTNKEIGEKVHLSEDAIKARFIKIRELTGKKTTIGAINYLIAHDIIDHAPLVENR